MKKIKKETIVDATQVMAAISLVVGGMFAVIAILVLALWDLKNPDSGNNVLLASACSSVSFWIFLIASWIVKNGKEISDDAVTRIKEIKNIKLNNIGNFILFRPFTRLALALWDQGPPKRAFRNFFITGNAWGLFHKNSHRRADTKKLKIKYNTRNSAEVAATSMRMQSGHHISVYKCLFCNGYHLGRNKHNKKSHEK